MRRSDKSYNDVVLQASYGLNGTHLFLTLLIPISLSLKDKFQLHTDPPIGRYVNMAVSGSHNEPN
jgi:hypothetical protein